MAPGKWASHRKWLSGTFLQLYPWTFHQGHIRCQEELVSTRAQSGCCCPSKLDGGTSFGTCRRGDSGRCSKPLAQVSSVTKHSDHVCPAIPPWGALL